MNDLEDKVVLITGGASGVGSGVVRLLMEEKVQHVAILDIAKDAGEAFQDELNAKYGPDKVKFHLCDITDEEVFLLIMAEVKNTRGHIDVVINNAAIMNDSWQTYKKEISINVMALVTGSLRALEMMRRDEGGKGGTIINMSSVVALCQHPTLPVYWATKSAVLQFSNCLGMEEHYSRSGVRVITVCLGVTDTGLLKPQKTGRFDKYYDAQYGEAFPTMRLQKMESAAKGIVEAYKRGESGSTWLATRDEPVKDITGDIRKAYDILAVHAMP
ncbi:15-hydroxyprostaglandin dehydrogenase [NAD(+)]-like isoform X1 [Cydia pomonella]|uniref:15-hydroxyprostaglandin dehydrogenase [NAD(+)]-like isoform X1 n=1 Tax=Cydia pomonella TaxID=82600 RepID=UPI002ADE51CE|nr:15-hydroxyprostaglandin dehydrogenase [NAD(+)]-like isoform X1 [Cydia pomonella]XP_061712003.1 15-hydroxyprostaglandin dehydrogenase [NAD(+)]-like isoform X1 [Cydia pomonella]XP_061712004.1 15-hydroxyprostaglandin dehydrogenase [NAD(+)]-like isoform X1 [Cydia pomonella]